MNNGRKDVERSIEEMFGFVPRFYGALPDAGLSGAWKLHESFELAETKLSGMEKELIGLAVASHIKCRYCVYFHTRAAELNGASEQQIREAIAMGGLTVLFSNSVTGTRTDFDEFKHDVDRVIEHLSATAR